MNNIEILINRYLSGNKMSNVLQYSYRADSALAGRYIRSRSDTKADI